MKFFRNCAASIAVATAIVAAPAVAPSDSGIQTTASAAASVTKMEAMDITPDIAKMKWYKKTKNDPRVKLMQAKSPAMKGRKVPMVVIPAKTANRPTLYLLNGAGSGEQNTDWVSHSKVVDFYSKKNINVIIPMTGAFSYYTDWKYTPRGTYLNGPQKWETFMTKELPPAAETHLRANNKRAVAGMSMSATSALNYAQHNPGFYDAVGSFAGCAETSSLLGHQALRLTTQRGGSTPEKMWGKQGSRTNRYNDALLNAKKLRGHKLYISSATGLASKTDMPSYYTQQGMNPALAVAGSAQLQIEGGVIEAAANVCTHNLKAKLDRLGINARYNFRNTGTHSWPGWREDMVKSWPTFAAAFR